MLALRETRASSDDASDVSQRRTPATAAAAGGSSAGTGGGGGSGAGGGSGKGQEAPNALPPSPSNELGEEEEEKTRIAKSWAS